jgi:hypothetical protein
VRPVPSCGNSSVAGPQDGHPQRLRAGHGGAVSRLPEGKKRASHVLYISPGTRPQYCTCKDF